MLVLSLITKTYLSLSYFMLNNLTCSCMATKLGNCIVPQICIETQCVDVVGGGTHLFFFKGDAVDTTFCACGFVHHDCIVGTLISYRVCLLFFLLYDAYCWIPL